MINALSAEAEPEVAIRCKSPEAFVRVLSRRSGKRIFVARQRPLGSGVRCVLVVHAPDGTQVRLPARVVEGRVPDKPPSPGASPDSAQRAGMLVELLPLAQSEQRRIARLAAQQERAHSVPLHTEELDVVRERLEAELFALRLAEDPAVLGVEADADRGEIEHSYAELSRRYHPDAYRLYESDAIVELASEISAIIDRAYRAVCGSAGDASVRGASAPEPPPYDAAIDQAQRLLSEERYAEAQQVLTMLLSTDPQRGDAKVWLLIAHARQAKAGGDLQQTFECYRAVLEIDPGQPEAIDELTELSAGAMVHGGRPRG